MQVYLNNIVTAAILFPLLSFLITVPYMVHQYRRFGSIPWWRSLLVYLFIFYLMCAYFLVILPLPESRTAVVPYAQFPQLIPFNFVQDIASTSTFVWNDLSSWLTFFKNPNLYEAVFNTLLLVPLGMFLRYYFRRTWWQVLLIGCATSLFFELSQLTGLFGIYEHPYRLFDVDDLIINTFGAMLGFWMIGPALKVLPSIRMLNQEARFAGTRVSLMRRLLAFAIDMIFVGIAVFLIRLLWAEISRTFFSIEIPLAPVELFSIDQILALVVFFGVVPILTHGQTVGQKILKLIIVKPDACPATWYQIFVRYLVLFCMIALPYWLLVWFTSPEFSAAGELSSFASVFQVLQPALVLFVALSVFAWLVVLIVRNQRAKKNNTLFAMLNEHMSGTRTMTLEGAEIVRERMVVLDVSEVILLEQMIAEKGTPLVTLMEQAGNAVSEAIITHNPEPVSVLVVCGSGNNGGDGWVIAHDLAQKGYNTTVVTPKMPEFLDAEPAHTKAMEIAFDAQEKDLPLRVVVSPNEAIMINEVKKATVVVDALLGTGFSGQQVKEPYASWIAVMNKHLKLHKNSFLIAVDVPSGFSAQMGKAARPCVVADMTVTMLVYKPGLLAKDAFRYCGVIDLAHLIDTEPYLKHFKNSLSHSSKTTR